MVLSVTDSALTRSQPNQVIVVLDDDVSVTEGLALGLEQNGRTVVTCNDLESGQLAVEWFNPTHVIADVRLTGPFAYEGLDFIHFAKRQSPETKIILMTGDATEALQMEASQRGAVSFLQKPFGGRQLAAVINIMSPMPLAADAAPALIRIPLLDDVLDSECLYPMFQPVVDLLEQRQTTGFEALARCRTDSPLRDPVRLFQYAHRKHRVVDLEMKCLENSLSIFHSVAGSPMLFVNMHPSVFSEGSRILDVLSAFTHSFMMSRLVMEITEQAAVADTPSVMRTFEDLRNLGVRFAFDDFGVANSHLPLIDRIRPSFLKISQDFGTRFETNPTRVKIIRNFLAMAADFGCELILEGIEDESTAEAAAGLGIRYGQGYLFGRPTEKTAPAALSESPPGL